MKIINNVRFLETVQRGIEKEGLRITPTGEIAQSSHPQALGSTLTHPSITTDYSEALLEFITPKMHSIDGTLSVLNNLHRFSLQNMGDELIWPTSMPCRLFGDQSIPIAQYGSSNIGTMKNVYRQGLWHRYGRIMQSIAGIHYNFSMSDEFWLDYQKQLKNTDDLQHFKSVSYFSLIRNFRRHSWLLYYLFGASPVVDKSFLNGQTTTELEQYAESTFGLPYATSLRMSDIGYQNSVQSVLRVCYNELETYLSTLEDAVQQKHSDYEEIGVKVDGQFKQLNTNILQLENEYYSDIRPKRVTNPGEKPIHALRDRGVEYIEVRVLDINPFLDVGIDAEQIKFLDAFLLYCLFADSPECNSEELDEINANKRQVILKGRDLGLELMIDGQVTPFSTQAQKIIDGVESVAMRLDDVHGGNSYANAVDSQNQKLNDVALTPSGKMMELIKQGNEFMDLSLSLAKQVKEQFVSQPLTVDEINEFSKVAADSILKQSQIEAADEVSFDEFLRQYHQQ